MAAALPGATARRRQPHADKRSDLVAPRGSRQSNPTIVVVKTRPPPSPCTPILHIASPETPPPTRSRSRYRAFCHNKQGFLTATRSPSRTGPSLRHGGRARRATENHPATHAGRARMARRDPPTLHRGPQHRPNRGRGGCAIRGRGRDPSPDVVTPRVAGGSGATQHAGLVRALGLAPVCSCDAEGTVEFVPDPRSAGRTPIAAA